MATVILSPWPSSTVALANAQARLKASVAELDDDARVSALGATASALVERYAPDAPSAVKNESVIRVAAWLNARMPRTLQSASIGGMRADFRERHYSPAALTNSGAKSILAPWRLRRALPVEDSS